MAEVAKIATWLDLNDVKNGISAENYMGTKNGKSAESSNGPVEIRVEGVICGILHS